MLSNESYVKDSVELHLFFLRIMKEHMIFIAASLSPRDPNFGVLAEELKIRLEEFLRGTIKISRGIIRQDIRSSGEIVTKYTLSAEKMTEFYLGSHISTDITNSEISLVMQPYQDIRITPEIVEYVKDMNERIIPILEDVIKFKKRILNDVLSCKMFTMNYPSLIDHILREAKLYLKLLRRIENKEEVNIAREMLDEENFWNDIMGEHAAFIRGLLDPSEKDLIKIADNFSNEFERLEEKGKNVHGSIRSLEALTRESLDKALKIKEFKQQGVEGVLGCKIKSVIIPLLTDHVLREANHYIRLLNSYSKIKSV